MLVQESPLELKSPNQSERSEIWRVQATSLWHVTTQGTPRIFSPGSLQAGTPEWHPRPGEELMINVARPLAVAGPTRTIDSANYRITQGKRMLESVLTMTIRASKSAPHVVQLPSDAQVMHVKINNKAIPVQVDAGKVPFELSPGK